MNTSTLPFGHVIWDWNGTLLDDKWLCIESINQLLTARNLKPINEEIYDRIFRFPVRDYYRDAGFDFEREPFEVPALEFIQIYDNRKRECRLQPGAVELIEKLSGLGIRQYLLSASETGILEEMTAHFGIGHYFTRIKGLDNHYAHGKVDLGQELMAEIEAPAGSVVIIGDTCHDQEVAEALGIEAILLTHGHFPVHRLQSCGVRLIDNLEELEAILSGR